MVEVEVEVEEVSNWDKLPNDILELIIDRLGAVDRIRLEGVCKGWQWREKPLQITPAPPLPWLFLPDQADQDHQYLTFLDLSECRIRKLELPESARGGRFMVSSNGWLLLLIRTNNHYDCDHHANANANIANVKLFLFDPISRQQIPLPPLSTLTPSNSNSKLLLLHPTILSSSDDHIFAQVAVSSSNASQCIVGVRFCHDSSFLALCRPRDEGWTVFELGNNNNLDYMLFSTIDHGALYVLNLSDSPPNFSHSTQNKHVITLGLGLEQQRQQQLMLKLIPSHGFQDSDAHHLVESKGRLLLVSLIIMDEDSDPNSDPDPDSDSDSDSDSDPDQDQAVVEAEPIMSTIGRAFVLEVQTTSSMSKTTFVDRRSLLNQQLFLGAWDCLSIPEEGACIWDCLSIPEEICMKEADKDNPASIYLLNSASFRASRSSIVILRARSPDKFFMSWFSPNII